MIWTYEKVIYPVLNNVYLFESTNILLLDDGFAAGDSFYASNTRAYTRIYTYIGCRSIDSLDLRQSKKDIVSMFCICVYIYVCVCLSRCFMDINQTSL